MATVNCVTGEVTGTISQSSSFNWINPNTTTGCVVSNVGDWCTASSYSVPQAASASSPGSTPATTQAVTGSFSFTCPCYDGSGLPHINIGSD
jgi:hypothetical protein